MGAAFLRCAYLIYLCECACAFVCGCLLYCVSMPGEHRDYAAAGLTDGWKLHHVGTEDER